MIWYLKTERVPSTEEDFQQQLANLLLDKQLFSYELFTSLTYAPSMKSKFSEAIYVILEN